MKRNCFAIVMLMACLLVMPSAKAQVEDTMTVPFGCFEQWNDYPGDTMTLLGLPVPINAGYSLPEGWDIPRYNINDTLSYMGLTVPINTSIPLAKVYRDSVNAPEGSSALVAETFMFQDILDPMAYSLAVSLLDTSITNANIPSVGATGQVVVDKILPLMEVILDNTNSLSWMLDMLDTGDLNNYITGGFPLNGFQPGRLLGYYKYIYDQSYTSRDFGAVIALGTRYDTIEHRRLLVGAGSKTLYQLYDTVNYESFYMDYFSIGDYLPEGVQLVSSENEKVVFTFNIARLGEKKIDIPTGSIIVENLADGLQLTYKQTDDIQITVQGPQSELNDLTLAKAVSVDLKSYTEPGTYEVPLSITLPERCSAESVTVEIVLEKK